MDTLDELLPREKMLRSGIASLSDVELLALFLRTGTPGKDVMTLAKEILQHFGSRRKRHRPGEIRAVERHC